VNPLTRPCRRGSALTEALGSLWGFLFYGLTIWGIVWSFYRHGPGDGIAAVLFPPYAWYRGVAVIWEKPAWKDDYDVKTEQLALVIENSASTDPSYQIQSRDYVQYLKKWIKQLPSSERERLHNACLNYSSAMRDYVERFFDAMMEGSDTSHVDLDPAVEQRVERFKSINGFATGWRRFVQDARAVKDLPHENNDNDSRDGSLTVADRAIAKNRVTTYLDGMSRKMESTIDELFSN
jgi:hypothetical protein